MTISERLALMKEINRRNDEAIKAWKDRMPRLYFSKHKMLYACWHDNSYLVLIAPGLHEHEIESHIFYSENAVKKYLEENGYKKL